MGENGLSASDVLALDNNRGGYGFGDNSAFWIFALLILAGGGFNGFSNRGYQPQYATQDFVQNGFNFNDLQSQNRDLMNAITSGTAQSVAATNQAKYDNINVEKDIQAQLQRDLNQIQMLAQANAANEQQCCCQTLRAIDGVNYNAAMNTAAINANVTEQTQKILDAITGNRMADMQNQINQLQLQNAVAGVVRYPSSTAYNAGYNPFCNCTCNNM